MSLQARQVRAGPAAQAVPSAIYSLFKRLALCIPPIAKLYEEIIAANAKIFRLEADVIYKSDEINAAGSRICELEADMIDKTKAIRLADARIRELETDVIDKGDEIKAADFRICELEADAIAKLNQVNSATARIHELEGQLIEPNVLQQYKAAFSELGHLKYLRGLGRLADFDYGYRPVPREWSYLPDRCNYHNLIKAGDSSYAGVLKSFLPLASYFERISVQRPADDLQPFWLNEWIPGLDAISIYGLIATQRPKRYIEIGSGNSTKFARRAISDLMLPTQLISIDPEPRSEIDALCDRIERKSCEDLPADFFSDVGPGDMIFVDNSHRSFQNSDVTVFFTEILPRLGRGCLYGFHDIYLPWDYPPHWSERFYNEQYLLMTYLAGGGGGDSIVLPVCYVTRTDKLLSILNPILKNPSLSGIEGYGGAFWMQKGS